VINNPIAIYVPVSEIYPDVKSDINILISLLNDLSRTDVIFWCARINKVISNGDLDNLTCQQEVISFLLRREEIALLNNYVQKNGGANRVILFSRGHILALMRWATMHCCDKEGDGTTFSDETVKRKFTQALLIAGDIWFEGTFKQWYTHDIVSEKDRALSSIRKSMEASLKTPSIEKSLGRGWTIFTDYFPSHYATLNEDFHDVTGFSIQQYFCCLAAIITNFMKPELTTNGIFSMSPHGTSPEFRDIVEKYISLESQSLDQLKDLLFEQSGGKSEHDFKVIYDPKPLRVKPIIHAQDGRAIISDPIFYSEKASVGPLFHLASAATVNANSVFGAFGMAFENYSCDIFRRMFPSIQGLFDRLKCNMPLKDNIGNVLEIDVCLNYATELVLFEIKAAWIREEMILSEQHENFIDEIRKKYGVSQGTAKDRKIKGVGQLARIINVLLDGESLSSDQDFSMVRTIYPVLLVYDALLTSPAYGEFLADEFKTLIQPCEVLSSGILRKNDLLIVPLIILNIDDLEDIEKSVENKSLIDILHEYSTSCPDRKVSLHNFLALSKYCDKYHNKYLAEKCAELLGAAKEIVF